MSKASGVRLIVLAVLALGVLGLLAVDMNGVPQLPQEKVKAEVKVKVKGKAKDNKHVKINDTDFEDGDTADLTVDVEANTLAFKIHDGKLRDDGTGEGDFSCKMDYDSHNPKYDYGKVKDINVFVEYGITYCMGFYESMPKKFGNTIACVVCPGSKRQVCGSNPVCAD